MSKLTFKKFITAPRLIQGALPLTLVFLMIEFYDEFVYAVGYAARPALRDDLGLTYAQIGLLMGLPHLLNIFVEPVIMLLGDTPLRRRLVLLGGLGMAFSMFLVAGAEAFPVVLLAEVLSFPSSGAFVSLSQATLMDLNPGREPHWMARWSAAGSVANLVAPLMLAAGFALAWGWRWAYALGALAGLALFLLTWKQRFPPPSSAPVGARVILKDLLLGLWQGLHNLRLLRWILLLQLSDLMLDIFTGYAALYFTDVVGFDAALTGLVLSLFMLAGLLTDLALIWLLEKVPGRRLVRLSAGFAIPLYIGFLVFPWPLAKVLLALASRIATLGWYPVMEGEAYAAAPGRSGTVSAIGSLGGLIGGGVIWFVGWVAEQAGLSTAMGLLLAGPVVLVLFVPKPVTSSQQSE